MTKTTILSALVSVSFLVSFSFLPACAVDDYGSKPETDPDSSLLDTGKSDRVTRNYVAFQGAIEANSSVDASIDYPDWLHGYTFQAEAGDNISVYISTDEFGYFFVYGPSHRTAPDGTPRFRRALHRAYTDASSDGYRAGFDLAAEESGTYLVVYGPAYSWSADYHIEINCADCSLPEQCLDDNECGSGEFCGWAANSDRVCKPWSQEGESCGGFVLPDFRKSCEPGLSCVCVEATCDLPGVCTAP